MAKRMLKEGGTTDQSRLIYGFRLAASRTPNQGEMDRVLNFYNQQLTIYKQDPGAAGKLIAEEKPSENAPQLAAWTMVANVLLNMDETISKE